MAPPLPPTTISNNFFASDVMNNQKFKSLVILYAAYAWFGRVSSSIIPAYLLGRGVTINQMFLANALQFLPMLIVFLFIRIPSAKLSWRLAIISGLLAVVSIISVQSSVQVYLTYIFGGISLALFFIYYNIGHFLYTPKEKTGVSGGVMYAVSPAISIFAPLLAGSLAMSNINNLWLICLLSFFLAYYLTSKQTDFQITYNIRTSIQAIRATRIPILLEGIWESVLFAFIPLTTLHFISSPGSYGQYLAYLSLVGTVAGLLLGYSSDKRGKRSYLLTPISIVLAILTIAMIWGTKSLPIWIIVTSAIQFMIPIFWNISTALMVDQNVDLKVAFPGREIVLAFGRLLGLAFTYICILNSQINFLLIVLALVILSLPLYLYYQSNIAKQFVYR